MGIGTFKIFMKRYNNNISLTIEYLCDVLNDTHYCSHPQRPDFVRFSTDRFGNSTNIKQISLTLRYPGLAIKSFLNIFQY